MKKTPENEDFSMVLRIRISSIQLKTAQLLVSFFPEKYQNLSHFVRIAIIKQIREEEKRRILELNRTKKICIADKRGVF
jgi:hypothetical protein